MSAGLGVLGLGLAGIVGGSAPGSVLREIESPRDDAKGRVAVVELSGVMLDGPNGMGRRGITRTALELLEVVRLDDEIKGVLLLLDTPGGSVTDADLIHRKVLALQAKNKKVVVLMGDVCASGGYYVAAAADEIWAQPTTITGSIGVIIQTLNVHGLMAKIGITDESIASGANKQLLSPTRPVSAEQRALMQGVVDELYERFLEIVAAGRGKSVDEIRPVADGRIFTAKTAASLGLIDAIGYRDEALNQLKRLSGEGPFEVVRLRAQPQLFDLFRMQGLGLDDGLAALVRDAATPRAMYLYAAPLGR